MAGLWGRYVPAHKRQAQAEREAAKLRKAGRILLPVEKITGRSIAKTFWGEAWCDNLEGYSTYENRLPRGRTYVRNGSVMDLQIAPLRVTAMVSGSSIYNVSVKITALPKEQWAALCRDCAGSIDSLVELLQGRFSKGVMERICVQGDGLFPKPSEIRFSCSCPDSASMCKHVAAALYGVGARLDADPKLLFRLRGVDETELVAGLDKALPLTKTQPASDRVLAIDDMSALFGIDFGAAETPPVPALPLPVVEAAPVPGGALPKTTARRGTAKSVPAASSAVTSAAPVVKPLRRSDLPPPKKVKYLTVAEALERSGKSKKASARPAKST